MGRTEATATREPPAGGEVERHQVVVVGAGPGGSAAAARLAGLGRAPAVLEAARFPRDKVCGDVLLPELDPRLAAIGTIPESRPDRCAEVRRWTARTDVTGVMLFGLGPPLVAGSRD